MSEEKPKKKRKKNAAAEDGGGEKEHKPNWRETYATVEEIKAFLRDHIYLRFNVVRHQVEARLPAEDPFFASEEFQQFVTGDWLEMSDRLFNTLLDALKTIKPTRDTDLKTVLESGFVPPVPSVPVLPEPSAALGRTEPHPAAVGLGYGEGRRREADALLRVPEEVARGDGGELGRRR